MHMIKTLSIAVLVLLGGLWGCRRSKGTTYTALSHKQQQIVSIAAYTAKGNLEDLRMVFNIGIDAGLTLNEIKEILVQLYAYTGFPRSLQAINTLIQVMDRRQQQGLSYVEGDEAHPLDVALDKYTFGRDNLAKMVGMEAASAKTGYAEAVPIMDTFLKEHLFADIFGRDNLDFATRELVTISALSVLGNVDPMLEAHMKMGLKIGLTVEQLQEVMTVIEHRVNKKDAKNARRILAKVLAEQTPNNSLN